MNTWVSAKTWVMRFRRARLRTQLLLSINLSLAVVMSGLFVADYRLNVESRLREKRVALSEEARTVEVAVRALYEGGTDTVRRYIDDTCDTMNGQDSPGHVIEVDLGDAVIVSHPTSHGYDHAESWDDLVTGSYGSERFRVRIGERRGPVIAAARRDEFNRIKAMGVAAIAGAIMLNVLLLRLVTRPIERTVNVVREIGRGRLGTTVRVDANRELSELATEISFMSVQLARRDADRHAQVQRARRLQSHLIPVLGNSGGVRVAVEYHPADEVAGDFVDVIACPNGDTLLCVADVVGHGIHAAMGSAVLKALLLAADLDEQSPAEILCTINRRFCKSSLPEDFASMVLIRVCAPSGRAVYASAGHETGYLKHADGTCEEIRSTGMILGVDENARCEDTHVILCPGDLFVLLSDGVSEAMNSEGKLLGRPAVARLIGDSDWSDATSLGEALVEMATHHRGGGPLLDDMTVLAFGIAGPLAGMTTTENLSCSLRHPDHENEPPQAFPDREQRVTKVTKEIA